MAKKGTQIMAVLTGVFKSKEKEKNVGSLYEKRTEDILLDIRRVDQPGGSMLQSVMTPIQLLTTTRVLRMDPKGQQGYQRQLNTARAKKIGEGVLSKIETGNLLLHWTIFLNLRGGRMNEHGQLRIRPEDVLDIIDGQHRVARDGGALSVIFNRYSLTHEPKFHEFLYTFPINVLIAEDWEDELCQEIFYQENHERQSVSGSLGLTIKGELKLAKPLEQIAYETARVLNEMAPSAPFAGRVSFTERPGKKFPISVSTLTKGMVKYMQPILAEGPDEAAMEMVRIFGALQQNFPGTRIFQNAFFLGFMQTRDLFTPDAETPAAFLRDAVGEDGLQSIRPKGAGEAAAVDVANEVRRILQGLK